ncbi:MAG: alpha/beta hydrolase, partial [Proteobacteria bacterium]|nr:alpha/beta hydrolase [Pseudomonadota bacterium]
MTLRDGRTLGWAELGDPRGRPVLAFHGAPACRLLFKPAGEIAAEMGIRLIAPDRPGYGLSDAQPGRTIADWALVAEELLDHLGVARLPLLAISGGGPYAVVTAALLGSRITALFLVSPLGEVAGSDGARLAPAAQRSFFVDLPRWRRTFRSSASMARRAFLLAPHFSYLAMKSPLALADQTILGKPEVEQHIREVTLEAVRGGIEGAVSDMEIYGRPWGVDVGRIACPAVLWQGTDDRIVPAQLSFDLARRLCRCELRVLEGQGHFWVVDHG